MLDIGTYFHQENPHGPSSSTSCAYLTAGLPDDSMFQQGQGKPPPSQSSLYLSHPLLTSPRPTPKLPILVAASQTLAGTPNILFLAPSSLCSHYSLPLGDSLYFHDPCM